MNLHTHSIDLHTQLEDNTSNWIDPFDHVIMLAVSRQLELAYINAVVVCPGIIQHRPPVQHVFCSMPAGPPALLTA